MGAVYPGAPTQGEHHFREHQGIQWIGSSSGRDGRQSVGWRLFTIASQAGDQRLLLMAPPVMRRLTQLWRERVHFSILRGGEVFTPRSSVRQKGADTMRRVRQAGASRPFNLHRL